MKHRSFDFKHALLVAGAAALAAGAAIAATAPAHTARARPIHLVEVERNSTQLDLGARGFSPGDRQTISSDLFTPSGHKAGRLDDDCAITQAGARPEAVCSFVITLRQGQLSGSFAQNLTARDADKRQAITGGTGRFTDAHGELRVGHEGARTPFEVVLQ
jgi:hypothetical protein